MPIINVKEVFFKIRSLNKLHLLLIFIFCLINIYFFNFPHSTWGGGFFHKASNLIFGNNYIFYFFSILSFLIIYSIIKKNFNNYLLLIILILFNPQLTIYVKYFDPLIFVLFLNLFDFDLKKHFFKKTYAIYQFYFVILCYYFVVYLKSFTNEPVRGSSYIPTPEKYSNAKCGLINIQNDDQECFKWCMKYHQSLKDKSRALWRPIPLQ